MRALILLGVAALGLAACDNKADDNVVDANAMMTDDANLMMDGNMDVNAGGIDANMATNAATENAMMTDLTTNDADTNLSNGM